MRKIIRAVTFGSLIFCLITAVVSFANVRPVLGLSISDYFTLSYHVSLSASEVREGQTFDATASGSATCKAALPLTISQAYIEGKIIATNQATGAAVTLNDDYTLTINPFPSRVGDSAQVSQNIPLVFPPGSPGGSYTVTGQLIAAKVNAIIWLDVSGYFPATENIGTVNYIAGSPTTTATPGNAASGAAATTGATTTNGQTVLTQTVASLQNFINTSGVFITGIKITSSDGKCIIRIGQGTGGQDGSGNPLSAITIEPSIGLPPPPAGARVLFGYALGPQGATFSSPISLAFSYEGALPAGTETSQLRIDYYDPTVMRWIPIIGTVDQQQETATIQISHFSTYGLMVYSNPADISVSGLTITPPQAAYGNNVGVAVQVTNSGGLADDYTVAMMLDGLKYQTKTVTVNAGETVQADFEITAAAPGEHKVSVNGMSGTFDIVPESATGTGTVLQSSTTPGSPAGSTATAPAATSITATITAPATSSAGSAASHVFSWWWILAGIVILALAAMIFTIRRSGRR